MRASLLTAAPRMPAITWEETANASDISKAEWGRWQPNPKYRRITFSCRGRSIRRISDMRLRARRKITFTIENVWGERRVGGASNSILGSAGAV